MRCAEGVYWYKTPLRYVKADKPTNVRLVNSHGELLFRPESIAYIVSIQFPFRCSHTHPGTIYNWHAGGRVLLMLGDILHMLPFQGLLRTPALRQVGALCPAGHQQEQQKALTGWWQPRGCQRPRLRTWSLLLCPQHTSTRIQWCPSVVNKITCKLLTCTQT